MFSKCKITLPNPIFFVSRANPGERRGAVLQPSGSGSHCGLHPDPDGVQVRLESSSSGRLCTTERLAERGKALIEVLYFFCLLFLGREIKSTAESINILYILSPRLLRFRSACDSCTSSAIHVSVFFQTLMPLGMFEKKCTVNWIFCCC